MPSTTEDKMSTARETLKSSKPTLLTLPAEIRNRIFSLAVVRDEPIALTRLTPRGIRTRTTSVPAPPSIARVCRQARNEVIPIYYGGNTFWLDRNDNNPMGWHEEIVSYRPETIKLVRSIVLHKNIDASRLPPVTRKRVASTPDERVAANLKLSLDRNGNLRISFPPSWGEICTCSMEREAEKWVRAATSESMNPIVVYAQRIHSLSDVWTYPLARTRERSVTCKCGTQGEVTGDSGQLVD